VSRPARASSCILRAIFRPAAPPQAEQARIFYRFASDGARKRACEVCGARLQGCTATQKGVGSLHLLGHSLSGKGKEETGVCEPCCAIAGSTARGILVAPLREEKSVRRDQTVSQMAQEVLMRRASALALRSGRSLEDAKEAVWDTEAGRQLRDLANGEHREERARAWQTSVFWGRAEERFMHRIGSEVSARFAAESRPTRRSTRGREAT
jgi:hypothetical protein